jgi:hypothetical protein
VPAAAEAYGMVVGIERVQLFAVVYPRWLVALA